MELLARIEQIWKSSASPPDLAAILRVLTDLAAADPMQALLLDQSHRWKSKAPLLVEDYLRQLCESPVHGFLLKSEDRLRLVEGELKVRSQLGIPYSDAEVCVRGPLLLEQFFSDASSDIKSQLISALLRADRSNPEVTPEVRASVAETFVPESATNLTRRAETWQDGSLTRMRFRLIRLHARGGLGEVFLARDEELHRDVAVKRIQLQRAMSEEDRNRFVREAEITGALEHPGIVPVYALGQNADGSPYYAMRFIHGRSLKSAIHEFHQVVPSLSASELNLRIRQLIGRFVDVCEAVQYAHDQGVLHRDIKPDNIMLGNYGETLLVDWGLAKPYSVAVSPGPSADPLSTNQALFRTVAFSHQTMSGTRIGTPQYMSPEQASGKVEQLTCATDIYSLGATLYHMLTGLPPFSPDNDLHRILIRAELGDFPVPSSRVTWIPRPLSAICLKAMALEAGQRYQSSRDLSDELNHWLADEPLNFVKESLGERLSRFARRHRGYVRAGTAGLMLATTIAGIAAILINQAREEAVTLADRNQRMADENSQLADTQSALRALAEERAEQLRKTAAATLFESGVTATAAGHIQTSRANLLRAYALSNRNDPFHNSYLRFLVNGISQRGHLLAPPLRHNDNIRASFFSPDGRYLATQSQQELRLWDVKTGHQIGPSVSTDRFGGLPQFSPDGTLLLVNGERSIHLRLTTTFEPTGTAFQFVEKVTTTKFSPDGHRIAICGPDKSVQIRDVMTGDLCFSPLHHDAAVGGVLFSPDGKVIATISIKSVSLWDTESGLRLTEPLQHSEEVVDSEFSPDGQRLVTISRDHSVRLWSVPGGTPASESMQFESVYQCRFIRDGKAIAVLCGNDVDDEGYTFRIVGSESHQILYESNQQFGHQLSPDGRHLIDIRSRQIKILNLETGLPVGPAIEYAADNVKLTISPNSQLLAIGDGNTLRLCALSTAQLSDFTFHHIRKIEAITFSPDNLSLSVNGGSETALCRIASNPDVRPAIQVTNGISSPDGRYMAAGKFNDLELWDNLTGQTIGRLKRHTNFVDTFQFSPDSRLVATSSRDGSAIVWNLESQSPVQPPMHCSPFAYFAFSPDSRYLLMSQGDISELRDLNTGQQMYEMDGLDGDYRRVSTYWTRSLDQFAAMSGGQTLIQFYDTVSGISVGAPFEHNGRIVDFKISPNGQRLAVACRDSVTLWDVPTHTIVGEPLQHEGLVKSVTISPDGSLLATASEEFVVRIWKTQDGTSAAGPLLHKSGVTSAAFSPDGQIIATGTDRGVIQFWDAVSGAPLGEPIQKSSGILQLVFSADRQHLSVGGSFQSWLCRVPSFDVSDFSRQEIHESLQLWTGIYVGENGTARTLSVPEIDQLRLTVTHRDPISNWINRKHE